MTKVALVVLAIAASSLLAGCTEAEDSLPAPDPGTPTSSSPPVEPPVLRAVDPELDQTPAPPVPWKPRPTVVAVIDTGINPYHEEFRGDDGFLETLMQSGYPGFPRLNLTFDAETYEDAVAADEEVWESVEPRRFYAVPEARIAAAASFGTETERLVYGDGDGARIRDVDGHGTMTSSRVAGHTVSIAGPHAVLVVIDVDTTIGDLDQFRDALQWIADQEWIDISVNAWGFPAPAGPAAEAWAPIQEAVEGVASRKPTLFAAGNGVRGLAVGFPSDLQAQCVPRVICVGGEDNGRIAYWLNFNGHVVADAFFAPEAVRDSLNATENRAGGTSGAVALAGGGLAEILYHARLLLQTHAAWDPELGINGTALPGNPWLEDGRLDPDELMKLFFHSARYPEENPQDGDHDPTAPRYVRGLPPAALWPLAGYGEVNQRSAADAVLALTDGTSLPPHPDEDDLYALDQERRRTVYG